MYVFTLFDHLGYDIEVHPELPGSNNTPDFLVTKGSSSMYVEAAVGASRCTRPRTGISREGSVELRRAIVELGRGVGLHHPDFIAYRRRLLSRGKPPLVTMIAVGHRAHRLAFAMLRSQRPYNADRWARAVAGHRHRADEQARHGDTTAIGGPPARRDLPAQPTLTHPEASSN